MNEEQVRPFKPKSFIFVQPHLKFGGAERQTVLVANELVRQGHKCKIILHERTGGLIEELLPEIEVIGLGLPRHAQILLVAAKLSRLLRRLPPSLVVVKLWSSLLACSLIDWSTPHHRFNYCEDLDPKNHANFIKHGHLKQRLILKIFRAKRIVTANTHTVASSMRDIYGLKELPLVIPSTISVGEIQRKALDARQSERKNETTIPRIATVGSLTERKGLMESYVALQNLDVETEWHLIGEGPLKKFFEEESSKDAKNVRVVVHGGRPDPYSVVQDCDLLLHNSPSEAFGIVLLESLAVGTPVVASAAIGPLEMVQVLGTDGNFISLFEIGDESGLMQAVRARISGQKCQREAATRYIAPYDLSIAVDAWIEHHGRCFQK